jgi:glycosyltransferase involved in cell wall biosynthesis
MVKLSIIIPVYNVYKYLDSCLSSVFQQDLSLDNFEVIIVNDGSTDASEEIILRYKNLFSNLIYIKQENQGVSVARNKALAVAKGNYITFVDSDDSIYENTFSAIVNRLESLNLDILYLSIEEYTEDDVYIRTLPKTGDDAIISDGFTHERRTYTSTFYKKDILENHFFTRNIIIGEDTVFNVIAQSKATRCSYFSLPYYKYRLRVGSASRSNKNEKVFKGVLLSLETIHNHRISMGTLTSAQHEYFDVVLLLFLKRALDWNIIPELSKEKFEAVKQFLKENKLEYLITRTALEYKKFDKSFSTFYKHQLLKKLKNRIKNTASKLRNKKK